MQIGGARCEGDEQAGRRMDNAIGVFVMKYECAALEVGRLLRCAVAYVDGAGSWRGGGRGCGRADSRRRVSVSTVGTCFSILT